MPFKSKAQERKFRELEKQGKLPEGTADRWAKETPSLKKLPDRITPVKGTTHKNTVSKQRSSLVKLPVL